MAHRTPTERDVGLLLLRVTVGGLMLFHGVDKVMGGVAGLQGLVAQHGLPGAFAYGVYLGEVVAPVLFLLGIATRSAAFLMAFTMVVAVWLAHPGDLFVVGSHGEYALELQVLYGVGAVVVGLLGPGRFAVPVKGALQKL